MNSSKRRSQSTSDRFQLSSKFFWMGFVIHFLILAGSVVSTGYVQNDATRILAWVGCGIYGVWGCLQHVLSPDRIKGSSMFLIGLSAYALLILWSFVYFIPSTPSSLLLSEASAALTENRFAWDLDQHRSSLNQLIASFFFLIGASALATKSKGKRFIFWSLIAFSLLEALLGFFTLTSSGPIRGFGVLINPNHHAAFIMIGLPLLGVWIWERYQAMIEGTITNKQRDAMIVFSIIILLAIFSWILSFSRGSSLATGGIVLFFAALEWLHYRKSNKGSSESAPTGQALKNLMIFSAAIFFLVLALLPNYQRARGSEGLGDVATRVSYWQATGKGLSETNFLGMGFGGSRYAINRHVNGLPMTTEPVYAHSDWVQVFGDLGLVGGMIVTIGFGLVVFRFYSKRKGDYRKSRSWGSGRVHRWAFASFLIIVVHAFFEFHLRIPILGFQVLALFALISTSPRLRTEHIF